MKRILTWWVVILLSLGFPGCGSPEKVIPAERARDHLHRTCTIELVVRSSKHEIDKQVFYLDSEIDYQDPKNLAVVIAEADLKHFKQIKVEDPSSYYREKRLRVRGQVVFHDDQYQVYVTNPTQIEIVSAR